MNKLDKRLTIHFLKMAADEFSNHGCNDFPLKTFIPDLEERHQLVKEYFEWNKSPQEYNPELSYDYFPDYALMDFMAYKLGLEKTENLE